MAHPNAASVDGSAAECRRYFAAGPNLLAVLLCVLVVTWGCRRREPETPPAPATVEEALARLKTAVREKDMSGVYLLLDQESQWSVMSVHKDRREICSLVRTSYPKERQPRELQRCDLASHTNDARQFFAALASREGLLISFKDLGSLTGRRGTERMLSLSVQGAKEPIAFCPEERAEDREALRQGRRLSARRWTFCGLRDRLERLKVKAARDLMTTRENAEAFGSSR